MATGSPDPAPRTHADELRDIATMLIKHGDRGNIRDLAVEALRDLAEQIAEWRASSGPIGHYGTLPPEVTVLRDWRRKARAAR
jgi:hypothetical protein